MFNVSIVALSNAAIFFKLTSFARWRESVSALIDAVIPVLAKAFIPTTLDVDSNFHDLISRLRLLISILETSLTYTLTVSIDEKDLESLWNFFRSISVSFFHLVI